MQNILKISIVTPSFNQGKFIERTIQSVFSQNYPDFEHIVIDGGSTDNTIQILKKYPHLIWISEPDKGQTHAINKGFKRATGEIIAWINSDDIYLPNSFQTVVGIFRQFPETDIIYSNGIWIDENDQIILRRKHTHFHYKTWLYAMADPYQPEVFYRHRVLEKAGFVDESFHMMMDREWWIRMGKVGCQFLYVDAEFGALRKYSETKTARFQKLNDQERWQLHNLYWEGFRFRNFALHRIHWKILHFYYRVCRQLRLKILSL